MREFVNAKKTYIVALAVLFVFVSLSETTYSLFLKSDVTDEFNYNTGLLDLEFVNNEIVTLDETFPMIDSDGAKLKPYILTLKNTGTIPYLYDLKMISDNDGIDYKYIKVRVNDNLPHTLDSTNNIISSGNIIYPNEEVSFKINAWLDYNTPNSELGKSFSAKIVTSGTSTYKTLDNSGANRPKLNNDMIPVFYDDNDNLWHIASKNNNDDKYLWYNYNEKKWANVVTLNNSNKYIYDINRKNDIKIDDVKVNNGNLIIDDNYLDIGFDNFIHNVSSLIFRVKFADLNDKNYIFSDGNVSYYYDNVNKKFVISSGNSLVSSNEFNIDSTKWYIIGYTYDGNKVSFYVNGTDMGDANIKLTSGKSLKIGANNKFDKISKITIGDVLIYNRVLTDNEIKSNYSLSFNIIKDGLTSGYSNFMPMSLSEYYNSLENGGIVNLNDVKAFYVWIPRFKYMVWNVMGEKGIDTYNAYGKGINIVFENGTTNSGVIRCSDNKCFSDINKTALISSNDNGKYYTHPAFSKNSSELTGFWVGKYEVSTTSTECNNDNINGCNSDKLDIYAKLNYNVWRNNSLVNYYKAVSKMGDGYHIIKNTEWGAISYLTYSKYGMCTDNKCNNVMANDKYISGSSNSDTTTGNMYGVFDLAGGASEYMMSSLGNVDILVNDLPISNDDYNLYKDDVFILGDATREISLENGIWYNDTFDINNNEYWIIRGGNITSNMKGLYAYNTISNDGDFYVSTRIVYK